MKTETTNFFGTRQSQKDEYDRQYDLGKVKKIKKKKEKPEYDFQEVYERKMGRKD